MIGRVPTDEPFRVYSEEEYLAGTGAGRTLVIEAPSADQPRGRAPLLLVAACVLLAILARQAVLGAGSRTQALPDGLPERGARARAGRLTAPVSATERTSAAGGHIGLDRRASHRRRPHEPARRPGRWSRRAPSAASGRRPAAHGKGAPPPVSVRLADTPAGRARAPVSVTRAVEATRRGRPDFTFEHR